MYTICQNVYNQVSVTNIVVQICTDFTHMVTDIVLQSHYKGAPPPPTQSVKISTLYPNFLIDYCRDFSLILHICTRPQVDSLVRVPGPVSPCIAE